MKQPCYSGQLISYTIYSKYNIQTHFHLLPPTKEEVNVLPVFVCLSVCLLARLLKTRAWISMKCCVSTDVGTWTNWFTFEPDPDYSPDAVTGLLSPISYISHAMRNFTSVKSDVYALVVAARRGFKMVLRPTAAATRVSTIVSFTDAVSRRNTFVGGTYAKPSALLVLNYNSLRLYRTQSIFTWRFLLLEVEEKLFVCGTVLC